MNEEKENQQKEMLDVLQKIKRTLSVIEQNQMNIFDNHENNMSIIRKEVNEHSDRIANKLSSLKWVIWSALAAIFLTLKFGL